MTAAPPLPPEAAVARLEIANGPVRASLMTLGAAVTELRMEGVAHSLVLGSPDLAAYRDAMRYFGAVVGPVANRIAGARAPLGGRVLDLAANEGPNALHGGPRGTSTRLWRLADRDAASARFDLTWPDGEDGLPGPLHLSATYAIEADGALRIELEGEGEAPTLCNPAFHGYWVLDGSGTLHDHRLAVAAERYLPVDAAGIPTGDPAPVAGTPFDFRSPRAIGPDSAVDHNFCLDGAGYREVARLETDALALAVETDAPGLQIYDAARIDTAPFAGHEGRPYGAHGGLAIEPQLWPDAPNRPGYPPVALVPGERFRQTSRFRLTAKETA